MYLWVWVHVMVAWLTSFSSQAHPIGQNREAGIVKEARAGQVHLRGLQSKLVQLLGQQAKLFALAATFLLQISYLWLHRQGEHTYSNNSFLPVDCKWENPPFNTIILNIINLWQLILGVNVWWNVILYYCCLLCFVLGGVWVQNNQCKHWLVGKEVFEHRVVCFKVDLSFYTSVMWKDLTLWALFLWQCNDQHRQHCLVFSWPWNSFCPSACITICNSCRYVVLCVHMVLLYTTQTAKWFPREADSSLVELLSQQLWLVQLFLKLQKLAESILINPVTLWSTFTITQPICTLCCCTYMNQKKQLHLGTPTCACTQDVQRCVCCCTCAIKIGPCM